MAKKIALDAGHGLKTSGKQTPDGIKEWTLNNKVRGKVVSLLKDYDVEIIFPDNNEGYVDESLSSRLLMYMKAGVDAVVSIHHNAFTGDWNNATGVEVYVDKNPTTNDMQLANCIYSRLVSYTGLRGRGIGASNWYIINQNKIPAVLVEGGFMDSIIDYPIITSEAGQTAYAKAIAEGLIEFLELEKKVQKQSTKINDSFAVRVEINDLNIRTGPGTNYKKTGVVTNKGVFTIVEVKEGPGSKAGWGKLLSGTGWISLDYAKRI